MKKFMVLYMAPAAAMQQAMRNTTPDQQKAQMAEWMKWGERHKRAIVEMGAPLGKTKRVSASGAADGQNDIGGYSIMQGDSADDVAKALIGHPHLQMSKDAKIEIIEIVPMPAM